MAEDAVDEDEFVEVDAVGCGDRAKSFPVSHNMLSTLGCDQRFVGDGRAGTGG